MTTTLRAIASGLALAAVVAACDGSLPGPCEDGSCGTQASWRKTYQQTVNRKIDLLFVVDDTPAIAPFAATLAVGFADMAAVLEALPRPGPASLHAGVVRAGRCDQSTRGAACGLAAAEQFLRAEWCETQTNYSGTLAGELACLADLGAANCAPAQPLAAAVDALASPPRPGWEGFLRPDAYLMVVVIAAGDDASAQRVSDLAAFIRGLKPDPFQTMASVIVPHSCAAGPADRLIDFVTQFGANGVLIDLCQGQLAVALQQLVATISPSIQPPCATNIRDVDPATPGLQAECVFEDHLLRYDGSRTTALLPSCDTAAPPCWRLTPGGPSCEGYILEIVRAADWCDEAGGNVTIECLGCADANDPACAVAR
jgi:hypothetical protein